MCPCYKDCFKAEGHSYLKHLIHFHSKCDQDHEIFVHFFEMHPFGATLADAFDRTEIIKKKNVFVTSSTLIQFVNIVVLLGIA